MYEAHDDPYCYPGTSVLKNKLGLQTQDELDAFEASITAQRADEPLPTGRLGYRNYCAIHHHLFQDIYEWAGKIRTVRITKGESTFCYPEHIDAQMRELFDNLAAHDGFRGLDVAAFAGAAAHFLAELNAIHPFREGNGRGQNAFLLLLAEKAGHPLDFGRLQPSAMLDAMIASFRDDEKPLAGLILRLAQT